MSQVGMTRHAFQTLKTITNILHQVSRYWAPTLLNVAIKGSKWTRWTSHTSSIVTPHSFANDMGAAPAEQVPEKSPYIHSPIPTKTQKDWQPLIMMLKQELERFTRDWNEFFIFVIGYIQWASRKVRISPWALLAPRSLAVMRPFLSGWRTTFTIFSAFTYSSSLSCRWSAKTQRINVRRGMLERESLWCKIIRL